MSKAIAMALGLALSTGPSPPQAAGNDGRAVPQKGWRTASARLYSDILSRACRNGWRYPRTQIENGFRRHFEELKLQLIDQGYIVVPTTTTNNPHVQRTILANKRQLARSRQLGCSSQYWL